MDKNTISEEAYQAAANKIGCEVAAIKAVAAVEAPRGAFTNNYPSLLFERHIFRRETGGKFDKVAPDLSNSVPSYKDRSYGTYAEQRGKLDRAANLDRSAAIRSTSWGMFQIMGFNYKSAGFNSEIEFMKAMEVSADKHLEAFVNFVIHDGIAPYLVKKDWAGFARRYNGPDYAAGGYDKKIASAYAKLT